MTSLLVNYADISKVSDNVYHAPKNEKREEMNPNVDRHDQGRWFARFFAAVRERWWIVPVAAIVVGALVFAVSLLLEPRYNATAQLVYSLNDAQLVSRALSSSDSANLPHNISSDALTLRTSDFAERVRKALEASLSAEDLRSSIRISSDPGPDVIEVKAIGSDAVLVADIANAYAGEFVKERQESIEELLTEASGFVESRIASLSPEEEASAQGAVLKQQREGLAMALSMQPGDYQVLQKATVPASPYSPRPFLNLLLGLCAGLVLGLMLAFMLDLLDRRVESRATPEQIMELPIIGSIPSVSGRSKKSPAGIEPAVGFQEGSEVLLQSMHVLRSNLKTLGFGETTRSVMVTSATAAEGKTTLAANLAICMALAGDRVVLVDADLRNPAIHGYLDIPNQQGLGDVLVNGESSWTDMIQAVALPQFVSPNVDFARTQTAEVAPVNKFVCLTSGPAISNPCGLLESGAVADVVAQIRGITDFVILDGPSLLATPETPLLARGVDALILVTDLARVKPEEAIQVRRLLDQTGIAALGIVVRGTRSQPPESYYISREPEQDEDLIS
ncbi:MAG: hypothetical protein JXA57_12315 [Armatimonadetes bacterium]|nr:hypothetical protein [Armatimonadota bacterium]